MAADFSTGLGVAERRSVNESTHVAQSSTLTDWVFFFSLLRKQGYRCDCSGYEVCSIKQCPSHGAKATSQIVEGETFPCTREEQGGECREYLYALQTEATAVAAVQDVEEKQKEVEDTVNVGRSDYDQTSSLRSTATPLASQDAVADRSATSSGTDSQRVRVIVKTEPESLINEARKKVRETRRSLLSVEENKEAIEKHATNVIVELNQAETSLLAAEEGHKTIDASAAEIEVLLTLIGQCNLVKADLERVRNHATHERVIQVLATVVSEQDSKIQGYAGEATLAAHAIGDRHEAIMKQMVAFRTHLEAARAEEVKLNEALAAR